MCIVQVSVLEEELKKEKHHVTKLGADLRDKLKDTQDKLDKARTHTVMKCYSV